MQVIEGESAVHTPGSHSSRPITVEVTDETGRPVEGAAVSFHAPNDGPTALFASGLRTEILQTDARGRATLRGLRVNQVSGRFLIRIVASKEQARVGALCSQYIAEEKGNAPAARAKSGKAKWLAVVAVLAGGAAGGYYASARAGHDSSSPPAAPVTIGTPSISVGTP